VRKQAHLVVLILLLFIYLSMARAVEPTTLISQYGHSVWRLQDGLLNAEPNAITQSADGYIWIATENGLTRFDGVHFAQWTPPGWSELAYHEIRTLYAASDGTLWIGTPGTLASLKNGVLKIIETHGAVYVNQIVEDREHHIWFATTRRADRKALCQVSGIEAKCFGSSEGIPTRSGESLSANKDGSFTLLSEDTVIDWSPEKGLISSYTPPGLKQYAASNGFAALATLDDGSRLIGFAGPGKGLGLQRLTGTVQTRYDQPGLDGETLSILALYKDREGTLWVGTADDGLYKIANASVSHYSRRDGLSGDSVRDIHEDREGNLWVATENGIDCFRDLKVIGWSKDQGLPASLVRSLLTTRDQRILIGVGSTLKFLRDGKISSLPIDTRIPNGFIEGMLEDSAGRYWIGIGNELTIFDGRRFTTVKRPNGQPVGTAFSLALAPDGSIWAMIYNNGLELLRFRSDKIVESAQARGFGAKIALDPAGGVWARDHERLVHYANGNFKWISIGSKPQDKNFTAQDDLIVSSDGTVFLSSRHGVWVVRNGQTQVLGTANGLPCQDVNGLVLSQQQSLWMRTSCGLIEIESTAITAWWSQPGSRVNFRLVDISDGARPSQAVYFPQMSVASDGRIWIGNQSGVEVIDPNHIPFNSLAPPVHIEGVVADRKELNPVANLRVGPLTRQLEIDYTALSLTIPQKVKFRYMLEGHDTNWQDPESRRAAFYNDLKPGRYRFRVIATNNDGVWNQSGDSFDFYVVPAWFQTIWLKTVVVALIFIVIWVACRLRVNYIAKTMKARFDERLDERTRLARDIHDTLLQTIQGSKLVTDKALNPGTDEARMRGALESVSAWLGQAIAEGRAAVQALRASSMKQNEFATYLREILKEYCDNSALAYSFVVDGDPRQMHPIVHHEISLIAREAIGNACLHSNARELHLELHFTDELCLLIKDDGIGIESEILRSGKSGHFGLQGMKERAARIHANITIGSSPNHGTEVLLSIPGRVAYKGDDRNKARLFNPLTWSGRWRGSRRKLDNRR
jgi:signal transduction histidine kinase/ligand-binding sensor domain-containing protein